jgi:hypothetical protein
MIDVSGFVTDMNARAKAVARLAPKAAATALRLTSLLPEIAAAPAKHAADKRFTDIAKRDLTRSELAKLAPKINLCRAAVARNRDAIPVAGADLEKSAFSKYESDPMAVEIRQVLRTMKHGDIVKLASADPKVLGAIVSAPEFLHGVKRDAVDHLVDKHLATHHPREVAKIEAMKEAVNVSEGILKTATNLFSDAGSFTQAGVFGTAAVDKFLAEHAPSKADLDAEAAGGVAKGQRKISMVDSFDLIMSDALMGEPA